MDSPFSRFLDAVEQQAREGQLHGAAIVVQSGHTPFRSEACVVRPYLAPDEFRQAIDEADLVLCHAGAGVIIQSLMAGKPIVAVPRLSALGEHLDDHQVELARMLAQQDRIVVAENMDGLGLAIAEALQAEQRVESNHDSPLLRAVAESLRELA